MALQGLYLRFTIPAPAPRSWEVDGFIERIVEQVVNVAGLLVTFLSLKPVGLLETLFIRELSVAIGDVEVGVLESELHHNATLNVIRQ